ncbi:hypothetical protein ACYPKM_03120 [Pseudomonas aeruginosa]
MTDLELPAVQLLNTYFSRLRDEAVKLQAELGLLHLDDAALVEEGIAHIRFAAYTSDPKEFWATNWRENAESLELPKEVNPGEPVVDQEGRRWVLQGLDPLSETYPVRLVDANGRVLLAPLEAARGFQPAS